MATAITSCENPSEAVVALRPNILLIILDDFGYYDLGANGNPASPTPNLDRFAAEGSRFTRHYADASCSASRAGIMTGTYPARNGLRPNHLGLSKGTPTIASALRDVGYHTAHIGKWHIASATQEQSPTQFGFDEWFGFLQQNELRGESKDGIRFPGSQYRNPWLREKNSKPKQYTGHLEDILTDRAIAFLDQRSDARTQPWFLNLSLFAPHEPIRAADNFRAKYPDDAAGAYHALIDQLDFNIGRVLSALDANGLRENTLVIVVSDNGGTNKHVDNNFPFYGKKTEFYEGGLRTPLLMRWPGHIQQNIVTEDMVSIYDIFPTIAGAAAANLPEFAVGRNLLNEHRDPSPQLFWEYMTTRRQSYSVLSVDGRWRLSNDALVDAPIKESLNDLQSDPTGATNVIADYPQIAAGLRQDYLSWRQRVRVVDFTYEPINDKGGAVLRGKDLLRSPGYAGFTFAIGITPSVWNHSNDVETETTSNRETVLEQEGRWDIQSNAEQRLSFRVLGESFQIPSLPEGQCSELVLSTYYEFNPIEPVTNAATVYVYVNGAVVYSRTTGDPALRTWGYANPTYVGFSANGKNAYHGRLTRPIILNEFVVPDSEGTKIRNGVSAIGSICSADPVTAFGQE